MEPNTRSFLEYSYPTANILSAEQNFSSSTNDWIQENQSDENLEIFGDSETDRFLQHLQTLGYIDHQGRLNLEKTSYLKLPPLNHTELTQIISFLNKNFKIEFPIKPEIKNKLKKTMGSYQFRHQANEESQINDLISFLNSEMLNNGRTSLFKHEILMKDFFTSILEETNLSLSKENQNEILKIIGGYSRELLKGWILRTFLSMNIENAEQILPSNDKKNFHPPDIDLRTILSHSEYEQLLNLQKMQMDFFAQIFCENPSWKDYFRFALEQASGKNVDLFQIDNICVKTSFGNSSGERFDWVIAQTQKRSHLFSIDALGIPIWGLMTNCPDDFLNQKKSIVPECKTENGEFQSIIDILGQNIYADNPEEVNESGWARLISFLSLKFLYRVNGHINIITSHVLKDFLNASPKSSKSISPEEIVAKKIAKLLLKCHESHLASDSHVFLAMIFNALEILKDKLPEESLNKIIFFMMSSYNRLFSENKSIENLYPMIINLMQKNTLSWKEVSALLQTIGFIKSNTLTQESDPHKIYLTKHNGAAAFQIVSGNHSIVLDCHPLEALQNLLKTFFQRDKKTLNKIEKLADQLFPTSPYDFNDQTQLNRNLKALNINFGLLESLSEKTLHHTHPFIRSLGYRLLLLSYFYTRNGDSLQVLIREFPTIILTIKSLDQKKFLLHSLDNALNISEFAFLTSSDFFLQFKTGINEETYTSEEAFLDWTLGLTLSHDFKLETLASSLIKKQTPEYLDAVLTVLLLSKTKNAPKFITLLISNHSITGKLSKKILLNLWKIPPFQNSEQLNSIISNLFEILTKDHVEIDLELSDAIAKFIQQQLLKNKGLKLFSSAIENGLILPHSPEMMLCWIYRCQAALHSGKEGALDAFKRWTKACETYKPLSKYYLNEQVSLLKNLGEQLITFDKTFNTEEFYPIIEDLIIKLFLASPKNSLRSDENPLNNIELLPTFEAIQTLFDLILSKTAGSIEELKAFDKIVHNSKPKSAIEYLLLGSLLIRLKLRKINLAKKTQRTKKTAQQTFPNIEKASSEVILKCFEIYPNSNFGQQLIYQHPTQFKHLVSGSAITTHTWINIIKIVLKYPKNALLKALELWDQGNKLGIWKTKHYLEELASLLLLICENLQEEKNERLDEFLEIASKIKLTELQKASFNRIASELCKESSDPTKVNTKYHALLNPKQIYDYYYRLAQTEIEHHHLHNSIAYLNKLIQMSPTEQGSHSLIELVVKLLNCLLDHKEKKNFSIDCFNSFKSLIKEHWLIKLLNEHPKKLIECLSQAFILWIEVIPHESQDEFSYYLYEKIMENSSVSTLDEEINDLLLKELLKTIESHSLNSKPLPERFKNALIHYISIQIKNTPKTTNLIIICQLLKDLTLRQIQLSPNTENITLVLNLCKKTLNQFSKDLQSIQLVNNLLKLLKYPHQKNLEIDQVSCYVTLINRLLDKDFLQTDSKMPEQALFWITKIFSLNTHLINIEDLVNWFENYLDLNELSIAKTIFNRFLDRSEFDQGMIALRLQFYLNRIKLKTPLLTAQFLMEYKDLLQVNQSLFLKDLIKATVNELLKENSHSDIILKLIITFKSYYGHPWEVVFEALSKVTDKEIKKEALKLFKIIENNGEFIKKPLAYLNCYIYSHMAIIDTADPSILDFFEGISASSPLFKSPYLKSYLTRLLHTTLSTLLEVKDSNLNIKEKIYEKLENLIEDSPPDLKKDLILTVVNATTLYSSGQKEPFYFIKACEYMNILTSKNPLDTLSTGTITIIERLIQIGCTKLSDFKDITKEKNISALIDLLICCVDQIDLEEILKSVLCFPQKSIIISSCILVESFLNANKTITQEMSLLIKLLLIKTFSNIETCEVGHKLQNNPKVNNLLEDSDQDVLNQTLLSTISSLEIGEDHISKIIMVDFFIKNMTIFHNDKIFEEYYTDECISNIVCLLNNTNDGEINFFLYAEQLILRLSECKYPIVVNKEIQDQLIRMEITGNEDEKLNLFNSLHIHHLFKNLILLESNQLTDLKDEEFKKYFLTPLFENKNQSEKFFDITVKILKSMIQYPEKNIMMNGFTICYLYYKLSFLMLQYPEKHQLIVPVFYQFLTSPFLSLILEVDKKYKNLCINLLKKANDNLPMKNTYHSQGLKMFIYLLYEDLISVNFNQTTLKAFIDLIQDLSEQRSEELFMRASTILSTHQHILDKQHTKELLKCYEILFTWLKKFPLKILYRFTFINETNKETKNPTLLQFFGSFITRQNHLGIFSIIFKKMFKLMATILLESTTSEEAHTMMIEIHHYLYISRSFSQIIPLKYFKYLEKLIDSLFKKISLLPLNERNPLLMTFDFSTLFNHKNRLSKSEKKYRAQIFKNWMTHLISLDIPLTKDKALEAFNKALQSGFFEGMKSETKEIKNLIEGTSRV